LHTLQNKNNIEKVMFLTVVAKPRCYEGGVVTFDDNIGTWAFIKEASSLKKV
jgi:hypothetical protein